MNSDPEPNSVHPEQERTVTQNDSGSSTVCDDSVRAVCPVGLLQFSSSEDSNSPHRAKNGLSGLARESNGELVPSGQGKPVFAHFEVEIGPDGKPIELGHGAMGVTYKAMDTVLRRPVALKVIASRLLGNESLKHRFIKEARAAASLRHPNIASVFYLGSSESSYFYAMELVTGKTLEEIIATQGPLNLLVALDITAQVASALAAAHQAGLVHRDIKPANLIVCFDERNRPTVKVIDFGLVKVTAEDLGDSSYSEPGVFLGTPRYASPEQFNEGQVDIRSDIYALGVALWQMLTKSTPFGGSPSQVAVQHLQASVPIDKLRHLPQPVVTLVTHLLEKDPDDRPQTPEQLLTLLKATMRAVGAPHGIIPSEPAGVAPLWRWTPKLRRRIYLGAAGLLTGGILTFLILPSVTHRPPVEVEKSVAVLPFDNIGNSSDQEYFSDGLTSEVIFEISKISDLRIISRDSVLRYKPVPNAGRKSLREIGTELEVGTILESSVRRVDNRVKIVTILYDARNEKRLWARSYDREMKDIFAIQSDLAQNIATALQVRLSPDERTNLEHKPTENPTAYDLYLRGRAFYELRHKEDNERAISLFRQAIEQDPKFALGYAGLANAYIDRVGYYEGEMFWLDTAIDLCRQAITIDSAQVRGYTALARAFNYKGLDAQAAELTRKALELAPNDVEAIKRAIYQSGTTDQLDEEYRLLRKCHLLDPNDPWEPYMLAKICAAVGEKDLMGKWVQRALDLEADPERHHMMESERMIFRRDFTGALIGLRDLPPELFAYGHTVLELVIACSVRVGDWPTAVRLASARLAQGSGNWSFDTLALSYLALSAYSAGLETEARERAERLVASARENLVGVETSWWGHYYLAVGFRFLDRKDEAYQHLRTVFPIVLTGLPLIGDDPTLEVFKRDVEFQHMMSDAEKKNEKTRTQIREIEKNF
jgi:serine/threonine protein kinase/tetratricopeptide (TPR) repeat protein